MPKKPAELTDNTELELAAAAAIEEYRAASELARERKDFFMLTQKAEAKANAELTGGYSLSDVKPDIVLARLGAEAASLRADDEKRRAAMRCDVLLHAVELDRSDEDALAVDLQHLRDGVAAALHEETELIARARAARERGEQIHARAIDAHRRLSERRRVADLPEPAPIPRARVLAGRASLAAELESIEKSPSEVSDAGPLNTARIRQLDSEAIALRAKLERARLKREEEAAQAAAYDRRAEEDRQREAKRQAAEHEALVKKHREEEAEEQRLADAYRDREQAQP